MAPLPPSERKPSARTLRLQRITGQIHPLHPQKTFRPDAAVSDSFLSTKRDKRLIKHSSFVSRINSSSAISKSKKRRRPSKKLSTTMESLVSALPELGGDGESAAADGDFNRGKVAHRSLRSRPGAVKRKERVVKGEMERFGASMARLSGIEEDPSTMKTTTKTKTKSRLQSQKDGDEEEMADVADNKQSQGAPAPAGSNRWAALRGYISSTMEQNPAFAKKS